MRWNTNPNDPAPKTFEAGDAGDAVEALMKGERIGWEPGDGTRYEFEIMHPLGHSNRYFLRFCSRTWGNFTLPLSEQLPSSGYTAREYVLAHGPVGSYAGVRPLLAALGKAPGALTLVESDRRLEAEQRESFPHTARLTSRDAQIGLAVRLLVEAKTDGTPIPEEARL